MEFDRQTLTLTSALANARAEIVRINRQLFELRQEEQRHQLERSRLEADKARISAFVENYEMIERFKAKEPPTFQVEPIDPRQPNGVKIVTVAKSTKKPAGTPSLTTMGYPCSAGRRPARRGRSASQRHHRVRPQEMVAGHAVFGDLLCRLAHG